MVLFHNYRYAIRSKTDPLPEDKWSWTNPYPEDTKNGKPLCNRDKKLPKCKEFYGRARAMGPGYIKKDEEMSLIHS